MMGIRPCILHPVNEAAQAGLSVALMSTQLIPGRAHATIWLFLLLVSELEKQIVFL